MYNNYKIVCNTAAGRRRYMQYLIPQVICSDIVDMATNQALLSVGRELPS